MLFKLPIILSGNSLFIHLLFPNISWNCKSLMNFLLLLKIEPPASIKSIPKDQDSLIEQSQLACLTVLLG